MIKQKPTKIGTRYIWGKFGEVDDILEILEIKPLEKYPFKCKSILEDIGKCERHFDYLHQWVELKNQDKPDYGNQTRTAFNSQMGTK